MTPASNCTDVDVAVMLRAPSSILLAIFLCLINLSVLAGNSLVIAAVLTYEKFKKKGVTNVLITSLALSDLLLATAVLPFSIANQMTSKHWFMGTALCQFWLVVDVLCCTASILNLVVIAFDRFFAIKYPMRYPKLMTTKHARVLVAAVWILAFIISFPPLLQFMPAGGGQAADGRQAEEDRPASDGNCTAGKYMMCTIAESSTAYIIYSASGSFFLPSLVMLYFYLEIYRTVRRTIRNIRRGEMLLKSTRKASTASVAGGNEVCGLRVHCGGGGSGGGGGGSGGHRQRAMSTSGLSVAAAAAAVAAAAAASTTASRRTGSITRRASASGSTGKQQQQQQQQQSDQQKSSNNWLSPNYVPGGGGSGGASSSAGSSSSSHQASPSSDERRPSHSILPGLRKRASSNQQLKNIYNETKAARMLAIIGIAFTVCWLPFFSVYLAGAFCDQCVPGLAFDVFFWMGYCNSALNPCIYALLSRDFRCAFRHLLCRGRRRQNNAGGGGGGGCGQYYRRCGGGGGSASPGTAGTSSATPASAPPAALNAPAATAVRIFISSASDHGCGAGGLLGESSANSGNDCY